MQHIVNKIKVIKGEVIVMETFKPTKAPRPTIDNIRQLKGEINISNDDLREVMLTFMHKLNKTDLVYALITMETELERRNIGYYDNMCGSAA